MNEILFEEFYEIPETMRFGQKIDIGEDKIDLFKRGREVFAKMLDGGEGLELISNIQKLMDRLTEEYIAKNPIACHPGCSYCCHQMVCCTTSEMELIKRYVYFFPKGPRGKIIRRARKKAEAFFFKHQVMLTMLPMEVSGDYLRAAHMRKGCIYLNNLGRCSIYPVRPVECRTTKTKQKCGIGARPKSLMLIFDQVGTNLISEEDKRIMGEIILTPLILWPISEKFGKYF